MKTITKAPRPGRKAAYYSVIGDPPECGPGDRGVARAYLRKIEIARAVATRWTRNENQRLYHLEKRWARYASGKDPRFEQVGTRPGRMTIAQELKAYGQR